MKLDQIDQEILKFIQGDIPLTSNPFVDLAKHLELTEEEIVKRIKILQTTGFVRRFGAVLRHQKAGYDTNAMVAWQVGEKDADKAGQIMAEHSNISHCYLREVPPEFTYNLFTMIHATSQKELDKIITDVSFATNIKDFVVLKSLKELKKTSMKYI